MILKATIKKVATKHLKTVLKDYPGIIASVLQDSRWKKFIELSHERCNQMDIAGYLPTQFAFEDFVQKRTNTFAICHVDEISAHFEKDKKQIEKYSKNPTQLLWDNE